MIDGADCGAACGVNEWQGNGNLPQCRSVHHNPTRLDKGLEPGSPRWEAGDGPPEARHGTFPAHGGNHSRQTGSLAKPTELFLGKAAYATYDDGISEMYQTCNGHDNF
jgi:hypothetical protein